MNKYSQFCARIVERCERQQWYGPDGGAWGYRGYFDSDGKLHAREIRHDYRKGFEFPPATEEQLRATEQALGFPLPPLLRALYAQVANGGFGPDYGITGARGGFYQGGDGRYQTVDMCADSDPTVQYVDLAGRQWKRSNSELIEIRHGIKHGNPEVIDLSREKWPAHFLHLCYSGCSEDYYLDGVGGHVFHASYGIEENSFSHEADSLEEWLELWLQCEAEPCRRVIP